MLLFAVRPLGVVVFFTENCFCRTAKSKILEIFRPEQGLQGRVLLGAFAVQPLEKFQSIVIVLITAQPNGAGCRLSPGRKKQLSQQRQGKIKAKQLACFARRSLFLCFHVEAPLQ